MSKKKDLIFAFVLLAAAVVLVFILDQTLTETGIVMTVLKKGCIYSLVAVSMNLLNGKKSEHPFRILPVNISW